MDSSEIENKVVFITRAFMEELQTGRSIHQVDINSHFERDLGVGSLEKVELINRIEKNFVIRFPDSVINSAKILKDISEAISQNKVAEISGINVVEDTFTKSEVDATSVKTLVELLHLYAKDDPKRAHIYLLDENGSETKITYQNLLEGATEVAKGLVAKGIKQGDTVAIMLPTCAEFFYAFMGTLLIGAIPVPIYPPFRLDQIEEYVKREAIILKNAETRILITFKQALFLSKMLRSFIPSLLDVLTLDSLKGFNTTLPEIQITEDTAALIQYTSGSTSTPKGVLLTHQNLITNIRAFGKGVGVTASDRVVSWLPLYHDMGLIGNWLGTLYFGIPVTIMSPLFFLNRPERWLWAIHYYRATLSGGPNFAYELCVKKIEDQSIQGLDLSSWRIAYNGAEAVYAKTLERFTKRFAAYRFKEDAIYPVYGLAESTVGLALSPLGRKYRIDRIYRDIFEKEGIATPAPESETNILEFVACGKPIENHKIRIVDDEGNVCPERHVGNIQFQGPSMMQGYYRNPDATNAILDNGWMFTGDMGYLADDEIFISGRKKDIIIKAGRNLYAAELEEITSQVNGIRKGCIVAFGVNNPKQGTEKLVIVAETMIKDPEKRKNIIKEVYEKIADQAGIPPDEVLLVAPRKIPKTSSGKLRRASTKEAYLKNQLSQTRMPQWLQFSKLGVESLSRQLFSKFSKFIYFLYTIYFYVISFIAVFATAILTLFTGRDRTVNICRYAAKFLMRCAFWRVSVVNKSKSLPPTSVIYAANHASYIDFLVLLAELPNNALFVGKLELLKNPLIAYFMKKMGYLTVDRLDFSQSLSDMQSIKTALQTGYSIVIFPEGTFTYATGLRPFKMGPFKIAVETGTPVCPIALKGTRNILRDGSWIFKPGKIEVTICETIFSQIKEWSEMIRLRSMARDEMAKYCGEQILDNVPMDIITIQKDKE